MDLFVAGIIGDSYLGDFDQFLKSNFFVGVGVEKIEDRFGVFFLHFVLRLDESEVIYEIGNSGRSVFVGVVGGLPESFDVAVADLCCCDAGCQQ